MPLLGGLLTGLFSGLVAWLTQYVTRKVAFGLAAVGTFSALTLGLYVSMRFGLAALSGYTTGAPSMFVLGLQLVMPPAASFCVASYVTMWTACTVYTWQRDLLLLFAKAT